MPTPANSAPDTGFVLLDWLRRRGVGIAPGTGGRFRLDAADRLAPAERRLVRAFVRRHRRAVLHAAEITTLPPPEERARLRFPPGHAVVTALGEAGTVTRVDGRTVYVTTRGATSPRPHDYTDLIRPCSLTPIAPCLD